MKGKIVINNTRNVNKIKRGTKKAIFNNIKKERKLGKMTKPTETLSEKRQPQRKATIWTRDKIAQLIQLYRQHECLWNHYTEHYKSKERRNKAIATICSTLHISKFDFGKKIHNLRNQFNSEMKKLERRIEEAGGNADEAASSGATSSSNGAGASNSQRCRWEHFESLMFLRKIIEPRPGGFQNNNSFPQPKKMRLKFDYNSEDDTEQFITRAENNNNSTIMAATIAAEDVSEYQFEETTTDDVDALAAEQGDDFQSYEEEEVPAVEREEIYDQKYNPATTVVTVKTQDTPQSSTTIVGTNRAYFTRLHHVQQQQQLHKQPKQFPHQTTQQHQQDDIIQISDTTQQLPPTGAVIELTPNSTNASITPTTTSLCSNGALIASSIAHSSSTLPPLRKSLLLRESNSTAIVRDQWDAFGELIASEFRHFNSDVSRKKLKRKIMQAMLEVGEEDDLNTSTN